MGPRPETHTPETRFRIVRLHGQWMNSRVSTQKRINANERGQSGALTTSLEQTKERPTFSHADADVVEKAVQPHRRCDRPLVLALWWSRQPAAAMQLGLGNAEECRRRLHCSKNRLRGTTNKTVRLRDPDTCEIASTSPCSKHQS